MKRIFLIISTLLVLIPIYTYAGIYGTLEGVVLDEEGKPVPGATVRILGTTKGAFTKPNGKFTITGVNSGDYDIQITSVGYAKYLKEGVNISADKTTSIRVELRSESSTTETVYVDAQKDMVSADAIGKKQTMDSKQINSVASQGVLSVVGLNAGAVGTGAGFSLRGSRSEETQIRVDGLDVSNQFTGGYGGAGSAYFPMVSSFAVEEAQVLSGTFSAEYGEALGGVVNTVVKSGRTDRYEGFARWTTDLPSLWGSQDSDIELRREGQRYVPYEVGEGLQIQGPGRNIFEFGGGGPIPLLKNSTFFISTKYQADEYISNSYEVYDPAGNNIGLRPDNSAEVRNVTGRLRFGISENIQLIVGGQFGLTTAEGSSWGYLYANTMGVDLGTNFSPTLGQIADAPSTGIEERIAKQTASNNVVSSAMVRVNHALSSSSYYELTISNNTNNDETSRRISFDDPGFFSGYDLWYPQDDYRVEGTALVEGSDRIVDPFSDINYFDVTEDGYLPLQFTSVNPLTGYREGGADASTTDNPYGLQWIFTEHGNPRAYNFRLGNYWKIDGSYANNFDQGEFSHQFKTGFDVRLFEMHRHQNSLPWDGNPFYDIYTDNWGGNFYTESDVTFERTSEPNRPVKIAGFVQDQISFKGIIFSPGVRFDMFMPNSDYRTILSPLVSISADSGFAEATPKVQISPRVTVSYPITERSNFSIGYGLYFQMPQLQFLYDGFNSENTNRGNLIVGDPNMDAQRTNQYEVIYNNQLTDLFALNVSAYYRDIYNQVGSIFVAAVPTPYYLYQVAEYGNAKGVEVEFRKRISPQDNIGFTLNYTLAQSKATSSSPASNYQRPVDPYSGAQGFPLAEYPIGLDIRHRINFVLNFAWFNEQGPSIGGIYPLENVNLGFTTQFRSGTPYTRFDQDQNEISEINAARQPSFWTTNMRISKAFNLADWFGEGMGRSRIEFFADVYNVFNLTNVTGVFAITGDPIDNGVTFDRRPGDFASTILYEEVDFANAATFRSTQYDNFGNRLYNANADFDGNGLINQQERFESYFNYVEDAVRFRGNFQSPRVIYAGVMFTF